MADAADRAADYQQRLIEHGLAAMQEQQPAANTCRRRNCRICGYPIEAARLRVIPHAVTCASCQAELEQHNRGV